MHSIKKSEKTLKFNNIEVNKKEFHVSKQPITLNLVNVNQIVVSEKFEHSEKRFKYFTKMIISLDRYQLFYLKGGDTKNILITDEKLCLL